MSQLYQKVYQYILEEIRNGHLKKGDKIPSENELADQFGVSRITTKKALDILAQQKVIERYQGKGSFVSDSYPSPQQQKKELAAAANEQIENRLIGLIIPDFTEVYATKLLKAIEKRSSEYNLNLVLKRTFGHEDEEKKAIHSLVQSGVEGLIVLPSQGDHYNQELLRLVVDNYPLVLVDRYLKAIPASSVSINHKEATIEATRFLLEKGHEDIAFLSPPPEGTSSLEDRLMGFHIAFSEQGMRLKSEYILNDLLSTFQKYKYSKRVEEYNETDRQKIRQIIEKNPDITAFVCSEYEIALMLVQVLHTMGKKVPQDYSVVCFDSPPLHLPEIFFSHIRQDEEEMGHQAVELLIRQLNGDLPSQHTEVGFSLVEGQSVRSLVRS